MKKHRIGLIGCGNISSIYLKNSKSYRSLEIVACADILTEKAKTKAAEFSIGKTMTVEEMMSDSSIDAILNLTIPKAHREISVWALNSGKHVYGEKPLGVTIEEGVEIIELAEKKKLLVGCAPDTFLGGGIQTCRKLIDDGWIGEPVAATAFMTCRGHESWHPDPEFYYKPGGGPMLDMGPYYITALVNLLGPVKRVAGSAKITFRSRKITSAPKYGTMIDVEVPTHVSGVLDFQGGASAVVITSFDIWSANLPRIEIYGTEGSLSVPDPNTFGGPVLLKRKNDSLWSEIPLSHGYSENSRGIGLLDMMDSIEGGYEHRANGHLALHVLEIMHGFNISSTTDSHYFPKFPCKKPLAFPGDHSIEG